MEETNMNQNVGEVNQNEQQVPQQEQPPKKLSVSEFASKIKSKYPEYKDIDDNELTSRMLSKYPTYKDQVDFSVKKKEQTPSQDGGEVGTSLTQSPSQSQLSVTPQKLSQEQPSQKEPSPFSQPIEYLKAQEQKQQVPAPTPQQKKVQDITNWDEYFNKSNSFFKPNPADATYVKKPVTEQTIEQEKIYKKNLQTAIDNTTQRALRNKGITAPVNSPTYIKQRKKVEEAINNGDAVYTVDPNTKEPALSQTTGFWQTATNSLKNAINDEDESEDFVKNMTTEQRVEYANKKLKQQYSEEGYVGTTPRVKSILGIPVSDALSSVLGKSAELGGGAIPFITKMTAGATAGTALIAAAPETLGASLAGLPTVLSFAFTTPSAVTQGGKNEVLRRYSILKQQNPDTPDVDLMKQAESGLTTGEIAGGLENLAYTAIGAKSVNPEALPVIEKSIANTLKSTAHGTVKAGLEMGGVSALGETTKEVEAGIEDKRYRQNVGEVVNNAAKSFTEGLTSGMLLHLTTQSVLGTISLPGQLKSSVKYALSKENPIEIQNTLSNNEIIGNVPQGTTEAVMNDINSYNEALGKTSQDLTPETQASVAGLIQKRDNLKNEMANKDQTQIDSYLQQIDAINKQITKITETNDPYAHEVNDVTGQKLDGTISQVPLQKGIEGEAAVREAQVPLQKGDSVYRVEYYDTDTKQMSHKLFPDEESSKQFQSSLTSEQKAYGTKSYYENYDGTSRVEPSITEAVPTTTKTAEEQVAETGVPTGAEEVKPSGAEAPTTVPKQLSSVEETSKALEDIYKTNPNKIEKLLGEDVVYHGTKNEFDEFNENKIGSTDEGWFGKGFYFHTERDRGGYGDIIKAAKVKLKNPIILPIENSGEYLYDIIGEKAKLDKSWRNKGSQQIIREIGSDNFTKIAKELGYDGVEVNYSGGTKEIVSFDKNNIIISNPKNISEAYHKAKADGSNPELVKAVEDLIVGEKPKAEAELPKQEGAGEKVAEDLKQKTDADIENRLTEIHNKNNPTKEEDREFDILEKEMEKRERNSVFGVTLDKVNDAVDSLMKKEKEKPNGWGAFIEKRDARETKEVADRYLNANELTDSELKKDFSDALRGRPTTWYADGLKLRESLKEASKRGIDTKDMINEAVKVYTNAGYDIETAKGVVAGMLKPIFEGSTKAAPELPEIKATTEEPKAELPKQVGVGEEAVPKQKEITQEEDDKIKELGREVEINQSNYVKKISSSKFEATNPFTNEKIIFNRKEKAVQYVFDEAVKARTKNGRIEIFNLKTKEEALIPKLKEGDKVEQTQEQQTNQQLAETELLLSGEAEKRRKEGKFTKDGVEYERNEKGQGEYGNTGDVRFTNDVSLPFKYKIVEADNLQPSHENGIRNPLHFIPEAQPKNRNDIGSLQAEESFANNPRFEELGENTNAYSGAPIVNERNEVVQGNNRSAGLRKGYGRGNEQYKGDLINNAEKFGFTKEQVQGMKNPILVREVAVSDAGAIELGNYDVKDLETGGKRRLDPIAITRRLPFELKGKITNTLFKGDETLNEAIRNNAKKIFDFLNPYLNQSQRNTLFKDGKLTEAGAKDIEGVIQHFLFDSGDVALPELFENMSHTQKEGLRKALPSIFSTNSEKSIIPEVQEAIIAINSFNESGAGDFDSWLSQTDMFNEGKTPKDTFSPTSIEIARILNSKNQKGIALEFSKYADLVNDKPATMFDEAQKGVSKKEAIKQIFKTEYDETKERPQTISTRGSIEIAGEQKTIEPTETTKPTKKRKTEAVVPEQKTKEYDKEDITGIPSKVGEGKEPIPTEPITKPSEGEVEGYRVLQAPGAEGEGKKPEEVVEKKKPTEKGSKALKAMGIAIEGEAEPEIPQQTHTAKTIDKAKIDVSHLEPEQQEKANKVIADAKRIVKAVDKLVKKGTGKDLEVVFHPTSQTAEKEIFNALKQEGKSDAEATQQSKDAVVKGWWSSADGQVHLNLSTVTKETAAHELFHPVLDFIEKNNPDVVNSFAKQLKGLEKGQEIYDATESNYAERDANGNITNQTEVNKEAITDYVAKIANGDISLTQSNWGKIRDYVVKMLETLGIKPEKDIRSITDLRELAKNISEKFKAGEEVTVKEESKIQDKGIQFSKESRNKVSVMKDMIKDLVNEGKSLNDIKEEMKDEFGDYYKDVEGSIEQAYQELTTTGIKNVVTEREREERGLEPVEVEAKRSFGKVFDNAKEKIANGELNGLSLATEIIKKPRPLSAEESAALLIDRMRISNEYDKKNAELLKAQENGETEKADIISSQMEALEQEMDLNDEAARKSGYEQGLGLAARRMLIAKDYSLVTQMNRLKAANGGEEVPQQYQEQLKELITKLDEANKKLEDIEKKMIANEKQKEIQKVKKVSQTPEQFEKSKNKIKSNILSKWKSIISKSKPKGKQFSLAAPEMTPERQAQLESISDDIKAMVKLHAENGETNLKKIISNIHNDIVGEIPELSKQDVEDIVLGKYDVEKIKTPLTAEKIKAQANVRKVKTQIDLLKEELKLKQRGIAEKGMDFLHGWHRMSILSGIPGLAKIGTAALSRGIVTRVENVVGGILSRLPLVSKIAAKSARHGDMSAKAEAKAFSTWFDKMTREDISQTFKTGLSDLDYTYGKKEPIAENVPHWMTFFGRLHAAMKLLPKRAEFFRSLEMRTEKAIKDGKDIKDPVVQQELAGAAYNDALRAVFMQDNPLTDAYSNMIRSMEKDHPAFANTAKFLFPVVKVPTNYVAEAASYIPPIAAIKAITSLYKGRKGMTEEQADYFMRAMKKGAIGTAFIFMGYMNPQAIGGYYTGKRKKEDLEAGDIELFGVKLPHFMLHTPLLEMLQLGATMRRASDTEIARGKEPSKLSGIPTAFKGMAEQIPFFGTGERISSAAKKEDSFKQYAYSTGQSLLEPQLMQNIADWTDRQEGEVVKRKTETFGEKLKEGVPGLRETLPKDISKMTSKQAAEYSKITDKGLNIPDIGKQTTYRVKIDATHPEGRMTDAEYESFVKLQREYAKKNFDIFYKHNARDLDKLQKMIESKPTSPTDIAKMNQLKKDLQNDLEKAHRDAIDDAKRKLKLK